MQLSRLPWRYRAVPYAQINIYIEIIYLTQTMQCNYNLISQRVYMCLLQEAVNIIKTVFVAATERDIHTGDSVEIKIITRDGVRTEVMDLKKD